MPYSLTSMYIQPDKHKAPKVNAEGFTEKNKLVSDVLEKKQDNPINNEEKKAHKKDIFKDSWLRFVAFTNEVGTAVEPIIGGTGVKASYIPALIYIGADTIDKYKKGENGDGSKPSIKKGIEELTFQLLASVLLPTAIIEFIKRPAEGIMEKHFKTLAEKGPFDFIKNNLKNGNVKSTLKNVYKIIPDALKNKIQNTKYSQIIASAIGLATLATIIKPIDKAVEHVIMPEFVNPRIYGKKEESPTHTELNKTV